MIAEHWQRIKNVLGAVDGLNGAERETALDVLCGGDPELRQEVDSLLAQEDRITLLNEPAGDITRLGSEPRQAGPYRIERLIGAGGMGAVYLATRADEQYRKRVAIKIIQSLSGNRLERRFKTERQVLASLEHPGIARLLDGGMLDDGRPYLVMEYVEGRRIDQYIDERKPAVDEILELFLKVCSAVQYAHQNLVVHRDLKPGNILVTPAGEPRLLDFGIAKILTGAVEGDSEDTRPFERLLTPSSASPEQVAGGVITTASDVYSLGLLLYRLLTGTSVYAGARDFRTNPNAVILQYDPPLASRVPGISPQLAKALRGDLEVILAKALEKEVSRRYQTVRELSVDLQNYLQGRPIKARPASQFYVARKFIHRNRFQVMAAGLLVLAIAGGLTGTILYARRAEHEKELAVKRLESLRRISESSLFEFHDAIKDLPGSTAARALIVRRALEDLDELASDDSPDPSVQRDLAAAYVRIGGILAGERGAHIGGPDAINNALTGYKRALAIRRRLLAGNPNELTLRIELLESLWAVALAEQAQGQLDKAIQLLQERLLIIQTAPQQAPDLQYSLGTTFAAMSDFYRTRGDFSQAVSFSRRSLEVRQALLNADPKSARARRVVGLSHEYIAYALAGQNKYAEAAQEHEKALAEFNSLAVSTPANADLQRNVEIAETNLCEMLARSGSASSAIVHCQHGVRVVEAMQRADSKNIQAGEDTASAYATMGFALSLQNSDRAALEWEQRAEIQFRNALAQDPDAHETASNYADTLLWLAQLETQLHEGNACAHVRKARNILERLAKTEPQDPSIPSRLSSSRNASYCQ